MRPRIRVTTVREDESWVRIINEMEKKEVGASRPRSVLACIFPGWLSVKAVVRSMPSTVIFAYGGQLQRPNTWRTKHKAHQTKDIAA